MRVRSKLNDCSLNQPLFNIPPGIQGGNFGWLCHQWKGTQNVGEFGFCEAIQVRYQAVEFGAEFGTLGGVSGTYCCFVSSPPGRRLG